MKEKGNVMDQVFLICGVSLPHVVGIEIRHDCLTRFVDKLLSGIMAWLLTKIKYCTYLQT
jgi:hypothetical protein